MKKMNALRLILLCFAVTLFFTNCQSDSKDKAETSTETSTDPLSTIDNAAELISVEDGAKDVKTPDQIAQETVAGMPTTTVEWVNTEHDFGTINKNQVVSTTFKFKNTGKNPLVIASAKAGCGCTVPSKPDEPILPGKTGEIKVDYNGSGTGDVTKFVDVILNTEAQTEKLTIKTKVLEPAPAGQ